MGQIVQGGVMTQDWVTIPLEQLIQHRSHTDGVLAIKQCALCPARTVPSSEHTADEQILLHLERRHEATAEGRTKRVPARLRRKLIKLGWSPPVVEPSEPTGSEQSSPPDQVAEHPVLHLP